jgi:hydrogenase nickel incorporation protein HypB
MPADERLFPTPAADRAPDRIRTHLQSHRICSFDLRSRPGAGKTALLEQVFLELGGRLDVTLVCFDPHSAERLRDQAAHVVLAAGPAPTADALLEALRAADLSRTELLLVESSEQVGSEVWSDLGLDTRVAVVPVSHLPADPDTEARVRDADYVVLTKTDLPDGAARAATARSAWQAQLPMLRVFPCSAETGDGVAAWCTQLEARVGDAVIA